MLSWQSILRIGCQTERLAQLRAFAIIGVILLQRRSRITMPPCEYFTLFYIQCGVYTEFGIEPRNKFTLSIRTVKSGSVSHFPFSILFCFAVLCCNIYSFFFFSALVCSTVLYCSLLFCTLLCSVDFPYDKSRSLCTFSPRNSDFSPRNPEHWKNTPDSTNY